MTSTKLQNITLTNNADDTSVMYMLENPLTAPSDKRITILTLFNNFVSRLTNYMTKTVYDTNNSGVVDNSERLGGQTALYYTNTANITDSTDKRFVTDTQLTNIGTIANKANDNAVVHLSGVETITGAKTYNTDTLKAPNIASVDDFTIKTATNKTVVLENVVWEDLNFNPLSGSGPAATLPDVVTINNVFYKEFTSANNQTCGDQKEIPHAACINKNLKMYPHLHCFLKSGETAGTTGVQFTIFWEMRENGNIIRNGSVVLLATSAELTNNTSKLNLNDATGFDASTLIGGQLALRLARTGGNAGDVIVTTYGVHLGIDTIGSRQVAVK